MKHWLKPHNEAMFSYRHAFHAGNHADVLKHVALLAIIRHLTQKDAAITVVDTHAGAGMYRLDGDLARTSSEAAAGVQLLAQGFDLSKDPAVASVFKGIDATKKIAFDGPCPDALTDYWRVIGGFNVAQNFAKGQVRAYPGSPLLMRAALRGHDRLNLFELHPTDGRLLQRVADEASDGNPDGAKIQLKRDDGFEGLLKMWPPAATARNSRRGLVLIDPSYEIKHDYARVLQTVEAALKKLATGCYMVWYPVIARPEAHGLPKKLKTLATQNAKPWLHATLNVGRSEKVGPKEHPPLSASGVFIINPPHSLKPALAASLPIIQKLLAQGRGAGSSLESAG